MVEKKGVGFNQPRRTYGGIAQVLSFPLHREEHRERESLEGIEVMIRKHGSSRSSPLRYPLRLVFNGGVEVFVMWPNKSNTRSFLGTRQHGKETKNMGLQPSKAAKT